jgi:hypothetical protein
MIDPRIADYINANRTRFTDAAIRQRLLDAGYRAEDIDATWAALEAPDPDRHIGPIFWRCFWIWVAVTYIGVFLLVAVPTGMLAEGGVFIGGVFAFFLVVALLISWAIVAAVRPSHQSPPVALAIGATVPLLFLFLVAGSCYALVGSFGPPPEPARRGTIDLEIEPPLEFRGAGSALCQAYPEASGYSVYSSELGTIDGRTVTASLDVLYPAADPNAPAPVPAEGGGPNLFINITPEGGTGPVGYSSTPSSQLDLEATEDGSSGTLEFEGLEGPAFPEDGGDPTDVGQISGRLSWSCD